MIHYTSHRFKILLVLVSLLISTVSLSQEITVNKGTWGYEFEKNGQELGWSQLLEEAEPYPESYDFIKKARSKNTLSTIFGITGGALVGIPLGQAIGSGEPNWVLAIVGGALITVAIPLSSSSERNLKEGVSIYNKRKRISFRDSFRPEFSLLGSANGFGLSMRF